MKTLRLLGLVALATGCHLDALLHSPSGRGGAVPNTPTRLVFTSEPQSAPAGRPLPTVQAAALDESGAVTASFAGPVSIAIAANPSGGALTDTTSVSAVNGVATFNRLAIDKPGEGYTLRAVAPGTTVAAAESKPFNVVMPPRPTTGDLTVTTTTAGANLPTSDYTVTIDGATSQPIHPNGTASFPGLASGNHTVALSAVSANCVVSGGALQPVTVPGGGTASTTFAVNCTSQTGSLTVTTSTTGSNWPTGYTFAVDGGTAQAIGTNGSVTVPGLAAGSHTVTLNGVPNNCSVTGGTSRSVTVPSGGTVTAAFSVGCTAQAASLTVTTTTSGPNPPSGYIFAVDGGSGQAIGINNSVTVSGLAAGSHTVTLSGVPSNCTVSGGSSQTVSVTAGGTATAAFSVSCTSQTGGVTVTTSTSGSSVPSGYTFAVDGGSGQAIGINNSVTVSGLAAGSHTVALSGVPSNCTVSGGSSQTVTVPAGGTATVAFSVSCTSQVGSLTVTTSTTGSTLPSGFTFTVDGGSAQAIGVNGSITVPGLSAGSHTVTLSGAPNNCTVSGGSSQTVTVPAGGTVTAPFAVSCVATTGSLTVTTGTSGSSVPSGYTFTVDGGSGQAIGINSSVTVPGLSAASHTVTLGGVPSNCTVTGGTSQTVTVPAGGTVTAPFAVSCVATTGSLTVTTSTSGSSVPSGYTFAVDGGSGQAIGINSSVTVPGLSAASHTVTLSGVPSNCTVSGGSSQTVTVPAGGSVTAAFSVSCVAPTGSLTVTTSTSGSNPPSGYTFAVDGGSGQAIGINGSVTVPGLSATSHTVTLGGVPSNCTVSGGSSQTVTVPAGGSVTAAFSVSCVAPVNQPPVVTMPATDHVLVGLLYTVPASFTDADNDGPWTFTVDWGDGSPSTIGTAPQQGPINATHTYILGTYQVHVTVVDSRGASGAATMTLSVP